MKKYAIFIIIIAIMNTYCNGNRLMEVAAQYNAKHNSDSIVNKTDKTLIVDIKFVKTNDGILPDGRTVDYKLQGDLKKLAQAPDISRTVQYFLKPNQELKMLEAFTKSNPADNTGYWIISSCLVTVRSDFAVKPLSMYINLVSPNNVLSDVIISRQYVTSILNKETLQIETKNTVKP